MSLSQNSIGDAAISQSAPTDEVKSKAPPKRLVRARPDAIRVAEPR